MKTIEKITKNQKTDLPLDAMGFATTDVQKIVLAARQEQADVAAAIIRRLSAPIVRFVKNVLVLPIAQGIRQAHAFEELYRLSDRQLNDIGIRREEIPQHLWNGKADNANLTAASFVTTDTKPAANDWQKTAAA